MIAFTLIILFAAAIILWFVLRVETGKTYEQRQVELAQKMNGESDEELLKKAVGFLTRAEALRQAEVVGNETIKNAILSNTYNGPWPERRDDGGWLSIFDNMRILKVAGMNFRQGVGRYKGFIDVALVPEPKNEFDPNAIKVVAPDSHHLGYVPADQTDFVRSLTANEFPYRCKCDVIEGENDDDEKYYFGFLYIKRLD